MESGVIYQVHPVKLTDEERADRGRQAAQLVGQIQDKKREIDAHKEEAKAITKRLEGAEPRRVACEEHDVMSSLTIETVRLDTGAVVDSRAMTKDEIIDRQQVKIPMPGVGKQGPRGAKGKAPTVSTEEGAATCLKLANLLHAQAEGATKDGALVLAKLADAVTGMVDPASAVAAIMLASNDRRRSEDERVALKAALKLIEAGKHLAKAN